MPVSLKLTRLIPFEIASMQFTEQITVNNFFLFIRKNLEHPRLQDLGIPVHQDTCTELLVKSEVSLAKLLLMQLEVRDRGNLGML